MKRQSLISLALMAVALGAASPRQATAQATDWQQIKIAPLSPFHPKEPKRIDLPNGMVIFLQEDHELPLIDGAARIRGGSRSEPASKVGLVDMYGEVWRTGGTKTKTGDQLDDFLEVRAARVETSSRADSTSISWSCLKGDFDDVFKVFTELLRQPEFRADKVDLVQKEYFDAISRRNDEVGEVAGRESVKLAYGANNPYAREAEYATVAALTRQDLVDWHRQHMFPNNIILGIVGDFDSAQMEAKLRQAFGAWAKGPAAKKEDIQFQPAQPGYYLIPKEDVNQSSIRMVGMGIRRDNPDYYAIQVFNEAFGGGFSSRLFRSIRTEKGLAYDVGGGVGTAFDHPGILRMSMGTKSSSTVEAIQAIYEQIDNLGKQPISDEEIQRAKDAILNSFVFNLDSPDKLLREQMAYAFYGYPADFLEKYRQGIEKVGRADVARVATQYLHKDKLAVLVVGNTAEFDKPLTSLGSVTKVDITIPPPPGEQQPAAKPAGSNPAGSSPAGSNPASSNPASSNPAGSNPEGKALAAKVVAALGGEAKLQSIKSLHSKFTATQAGGEPTSLEATIVFPDHMRVNIQTPGGLLSIVVSPSVGFMSAEGRGLRDMPAAQKAETMEQIKRDLVYLGQHLNDPAFSFAATGKEKVGDIEASIVDVSGNGTAMRWYVDPESGRVLRETYNAVGSSGPFKGETDLDDWKTSDGLTLPYSHKNKQDGQDSSTVQFSAIETNPTVDPKLFEKPASEAKPAQ